MGKDLGRSSPEGAANRLLWPAPTMPPDPRPAFRPGFRFAPSDGVVLVAGAVGVAMAWRVEPWFGVAVAVPVVMFFVFCNVVRMARRLELVWAAAYVAACLARQALGWPNWPWLVAGSVALGSGLVAMQLRRPDYHGVGWRRCNPQLPEWWASRSQTPA